MRLVARERVVAGRRVAVARAGVVLVPEPQVAAATVGVVRGQAMARARVARVAAARAAAVTASVLWAVVVMVGGATGAALWAAEKQIQTTA